MAFKFSKEDEAFMDSHNYVAPEVEYDQSTVSAAFTTFNTVGSMYLRGAANREPVDMTQFEGREFTKDNLREYVKEQNLGTQIEDEVMITPSLGNWEDAARRISYLQNLHQREQQIANELSTGEMLGLGLTFGLVDADMLLYNPLLKGVSALKKTANISLATKTSRVLDHAATGGLVGATSMLTYEATTGVYHDNSTVNAALIGMALGGTLGGFIELSKASKNNATFEDLAGNNVPRELAKVEEIAAREQKIAQMDEVINLEKQLKKEERDVKTQLDRSEKNDRGVVRFDNRLKKTALERTLNTAKKAADNAGTIFKTAAENVKALKKKIDEVNKVQIRAKRDSVTETKLLDQSAGLRKQSAPVKGQITKLKKQLDSLKGVRTKEATAQRKAIRKKLDAQNAKLAKLNAQGTILQKKLEKLTTNPNQVLKDAAGRASRLQEEAYNAEIALDKAKNEHTVAKEAHSKASQEYRGFKTSEGVANAPSSWGTHQLRQKLEKLGYQRSAEGFRQMLKDKDLYNSDIVKMADDDLNISGFQAIKAKHRNKVQQLEEDIARIENITSFDKAREVFKNHPFLDKFVISPIERLYKDPLTQGLARKLHEGALHHGLTNTYNAHTIKKQLDQALNRVHLSSLNLYKQALKDGSFDKSWNEWNDAIGREIHTVNGRIQRQLDDAIPAGISDAERAAIRESREGSVVTMFENENKHIQKSVEEYLQYYKQMHSRGKSLQIDGFGGIAAGYGKRVYNATYAKELGEDRWVEKLMAAKENKAVRTNAVWDEATRDLALAESRAMYRNLVDDEKRFADMFGSLGMARRTKPSSLKQRSVDAYDDDLAELLETNAVGLTRTYGFQTHGRMALKDMIGIDNLDQLERMMDDLMLKGKQRLDVRVVVEDILGTREIVKNPFSAEARFFKGLGALTSISHTMGFGVTTATEFSQLISEFGAKNSILAMMGKPSEMKRMLMNGTAKDRNDAHLGVMYGEALFGNKANRMSDDFGIDSVGKVQEFLDEVHRKTAIGGGLMIMTDMFRMATATGMTRFIADLSIASKVSKADEKRLLDMGFELSDLPKLRKALDIDSNGIVRNLDKSKWGEMGDRLDRAILVTSDRVILTPSASTLPRFMTNMEFGGIVPRFLTKFMRFPMESHERLLLRGMQEMDAKRLAGFGSNVAFWGAIVMMKDALKPEEDQVYTDDDAQWKVLRDALMMNSVLAGSITAADQAVGLTTGNTILGYQHRIGGAGTSLLGNLRKGELNVTLPFYRWKVHETVSNSVGDTLKMLEFNED